MPSSTNRPGAIVGLHDPSTGALVGLAGRDAKEVSLSGAALPAGVIKGSVVGLFDSVTKALIGLRGRGIVPVALGVGSLPIAVAGAVVGMHDVSTGALVAVMGGDGVEVPLSGGGGGSDQTIRTLAQLETYRTSGTAGQPAGSFALVPYFDLVTGQQEQWSGESSLGGGLAKLVMDIDVGAGVAPVNGRPIAVMIHPTTNSPYTNWVAPGQTLNSVKQALLAAGYVVFNIESRHPSTTLTANPSPAVSPWHDVGYAIQHVRAMHEALNLDRSKLDVVCRSRGSLAVWEALQPDRINPGHASYAGQQSSKIRFCYVMQGQITYRPDNWIDYYIVSGDRAAAKSLPQNQTDARLKTAGSKDHLESVPGTATQTYFFMDTDQNWNGGDVTWAFAAGKDQLHWPDYSRRFRDAMAAIGKGDQVGVQYGTPPSNAASYGLIVPWLQEMDAAQAAGMAVSSAEVWATLTAKASGELLYYLRTDASGGFAATDGVNGSGALVLGGPVGALVDGAQGLPNRLLGNSSTGTKAANTGAQKPTIVAAAGGWAMQFTASKFLQVGQPTTAAVDVQIATASGISVGPVSRVAGSYKIGGPGGTAITAGLFACKPDATISAANLRLYRQLGAQITGFADTLM